MPSDPELTGQSRKRDLPKHSQRYTRPCQALVPATGPQESAAVSARSERSISYAILLCHRCGLAPAEVGRIHPHAMEHGAQLAGKGHLGALHAPTFRHVERSVLQAREAGRPRQHDVRRFKERCSHHGVADLADATVSIGLTGLIFFGRKPEVGNDRTGFSKPHRVVHRRAIGERGPGLPATALAGWDLHPQAIISLA